MRIRIVYALHAAGAAGPGLAEHRASTSSRSWSGSMRDWRSSAPSSSSSPRWPTGPEQAQKILDEDKIRRYRRLHRLSDERLEPGGADDRDSRASRCCTSISSTAAAAGSWSTWRASCASKAPNVGFVASSRFEDLVEAVKCFDAGQARAARRRSSSRRPRKVRTSTDAQGGRPRLHARSAEDPLDRRTASPG